MSSLKDILKQQARHALVSLLMGAGLVLPLMSTLGLHASFPAALAILLTVTAAACLLTSFRKGKLILWGALSAALAIYMVFFGGVSTVTETVKAVMLEYSGYVTAHLYAGEITLFFSLIGALLAWALAREDMGLIPATLALLSVAVILWATGCESSAYTLIPGAAAVLLLTAGSRPEEAPLRRVLPLALALALLSGLVATGSGLTIEPLHRAAETLRDRIEDYLFFTEPRNVFSLAVDGYYPQGQNQLGGTAEPSDRLVMIVQTDRTTYLRGAIKNEYTGRAWYDTTGGRRYLWISPRWSAERTAAFDMSLPSDLIRSSSLLTEHRVSVKMADVSASTLFVPQRVRTLSAGADVVAYFNRGSEVFTTRDLQPGDSYTVTAPLMVAGEPGLEAIVSACALADDPQYADVVAAYTLLPDHMQEMVFELAREICSGAETPYAKAVAIQNYLMTACRYTLEVEPQPENIDFVTNFLFNTQEGYCTYFASAMTVLCRMVGLPARYVEGYIAEPNAEGVAYVTGRNGHAWTEVYFSGFGWLTFDATPSESDYNAQAILTNGTEPEETEEPTEAPPSEDPTATPGPDDANSSDDDSATPTPTPENQNEDAVPPNELPPDSTDAPTPTPAAEQETDSDTSGESVSAAGWLWWLLLLLLLIAGCAVRILMTSPERLAARAKTEEDAYTVWVQAVYDVLCLAGLRAAASESPIAYMKRLDETAHLPVRMAPIARQISMVFYGKVVPEREEFAAVQAAWSSLCAPLKPLDRLRLMLIRAFVPLRRRSFLSR